MAHEKVMVAVESRQERGTSAAKHMRQRGEIPAVVYGLGKEARAVSVNQALVAKLAGRTHLVHLQFAGGEELPAMLQDVQLDYMQNVVLHADFLEVDLTKAIVVSVPVVGRGIPVGVTKGGQLEQILHEVEISCLPAEVPSEIVVDVSALEIGQSLAVPQVPMPAGIKAASNDPHAVIFVVAAPKAEEEETPAEGAVPAAAATTAEPELVRKPKPEEEEEAAKK